MGKINPNYPIRTVEWRFEGTVNSLAVDFMSQSAGSALDVPTLEKLMKVGDQLLKSTGDIRSALIQVQEHRSRTGEDLISNIEKVKHMAPGLAETLIEFHRVGVRPLFRGDTPEGSRRRGFPHISGQSWEIAQKLWKDVAAGRMFLCTASAIGADACVMATPSILVQKRLPDRTISEDMRLIADLRSVNLYTLERRLPQNGGPIYSDDR